MGKDLGTYHIRVELWDGRGWIAKWPTGARYTNGSGSCHPLTAFRIEPTWDSEDDMIGTMLFQFQENNWSCDCNRVLDLARAEQREDPDNGNVCLGGPTLRIKRFTIIRPDGTFAYDNEEFETKDAE